MQHVRRRGVGAELGLAGGEIVGKLAGKVGFPDNLEVRPLSVGSCKIGHI